MISNANYLSHTDPLFHSLNLLKVTDIGQTQTLIFMFKYYCGALHLLITFVWLLMCILSLLVSLPVYTSHMQEQTKGKIQ